MSRISRYIGIGVCLGIGYKISGLIVNVVEQVAEDLCYSCSPRFRAFAKEHCPEEDKKLEKRYWERKVRFGEVVRNDNVILCESYEAASETMEKIAGHLARRGHVSYHYIRNLAGCEDNPIEYCNYGWMNMDDFKILEKDGQYIVYFPTYAHKFEEV